MSIGRTNAPVFPLPVRAGSVVLFSAWLWHHSKNNETDQVRRAYIVSYQEATLKKGAGEQWKVLRPAAGSEAAGVPGDATASGSTGGTLTGVAADATAGAAKSEYE